MKNLIQGSILRQEFEPKHARLKKSEIRVGETDSPSLAYYFVLCLGPVIERMSVSGSAAFKKFVGAYADFAR